MFRPSAVPPDSGAAGVPAAQPAPRLDDLLRLPPGRARQEEILRIVAGLAADLAFLHASGQVHGGICPDAVAHGPSGRAVLATPPVAPEPDAEDASRHAGYAAFEQYTDDPAYPCGAWTDVHGLAALAYFLATGSAPPSALARRVRDDCLPLHEWGAGDYGQAFCDAVDSGLAMPAHARPQTVGAFAAAMGAVLPPEEVSPAVPLVAVVEVPREAVKEPQDIPPVAVPPALPVDRQDTVAPTLMAELPAEGSAAARPPAGRLTAKPPESPFGVRRIVPAALVLLLLLAGGGYAWLRWMAPPVQLAAAPQAPPPAPAPAAPPPAAAPAQEAPPAAPAAVPPADPDAPPAGADATSAPTPAGSAQPSESTESAQSAAPAAPAGSAGSAAVGAAPEAASQAPPENAANTPAPQAPAAAEAATQPPPKAAPVAVRVAVRPWGEVLINGRSRGVSPPLRELSLAPGRYQVTVRNASGGEHRMTLTVAPDRPAVITHQFE